jgi:hypothetical protein
LWDKTLPYDADLKVRIHSPWLCWKGTRAESL